MSNQLGDPLDSVDLVILRSLSTLVSLDEYAFQESIGSVLDEVEDAIKWEVAC